MKHVLITGSSNINGIGGATALNLAREGYSVFINSRSTQACLQFCDTYNNNLSGKLLIPLWGDNSVATDVDQMFLEALNHTNNIHGIVINASPSNVKDCPIEDVDEQEWDFVVGNVLKSAFLVLRKFKPILSQNGRIVIISSSAATIGSWSRNVAYASAKAGLFGLMRKLAMELASSGVTVNCIAPNQIITDRVLNNGRKDINSLREYAKHNLLLGKLGQPNDVSSLISYLLSDDSGYITGEIFNLNGGATFPKKKL